MFCGLSGREDGIICRDADYDYYEALMDDRLRRAWVDGGPVDGACLVVLSFIWGVHS